MASPPLSQSSSDIVETFRQGNPLLNLVTVQLSELLIQAYRQYLSQQEQANEEDLPYLEIVLDSEGGSTRLKTNLDAESILSNTRALLQAFYEQYVEWEQTARQVLPDPTDVHVARYITTQAAQAIDLPNLSIAKLEPILGINSNNLKKVTPLSETPLTKLDSVAAIPTGLPIVSSITAQLRQDLWQPDGSGVAFFRYSSKSDRNNFLEHYITNPGDIEALPWEAAEQIIEKFGFNTVKLQFILAAYAMKQAKPWESTFTLKSTDIIHELGWDRNHNTSMAAKRNEVAGIAYALSCLLVKAVWIEGRGKNRVDASTPIGRMWEILIDSHGHFDWTTGRIEEPDEVYITVRPGLWTAHFLNHAGNKAKEALYQFGYLALNILKLDPYHDELALRLAIHLTLDVRIRARNRNPYEYKVRPLLESVVLPVTITEARNSSAKARSLFNRWNQALKLLIELGWEAEYIPPSPDWLDATSKVKKPKGWIDLWLEQRLNIKPPAPIPDKLGTLTERPKLQAKRSKPAPEVEERISGEIVRQARKARGWTQTKLAGVLDVHQSLIAKIESGNRLISPELETALRKVLNL